ncbi:MAG: nucleotide exchange factor GrpE [Deltaproteobacteria bacterium]|nr:nucleotide exchange factor GrpE [Deltaproteobacteria bacterium]
MTENQDTQAPTDSADAPGAAAPDVSPEDRIATLEQEKNDLRERMLRVAAEFENWKKRARKDQDDAQFRAKEQVLKDVLEVVDNLERALSSMTETSDSKAVKDGVNLVLRLFHQKLERHDVKVIESKGKAFDPRIHEAVAQVPSTDVPVGAIVDELVKGYNMGERLLRPAAVVVAIAPPSTGAEAN